MAGLSIKANYTEASIRNEVSRAVEEYFKYVTSTYSKAGKAMVEDARSRTKDLGALDGGSFGNITWELRSSIACGVYRDGSQVYFYGPVLSTGSDGVSAAKDYLDELAVGIEGIQLIVVAGKDYARAVESKGYNVISSTADGADNILNKYLNENR